MADVCHNTPNACPVRAICEEVNRCVREELRVAGYAVTARPQSWTLPPPGSPPFRYVAKARNAGTREALVIGSADVRETALVMCESFARDAAGFGSQPDVWVEDTSAPQSWTVPPAGPTADRRMLAIAVDVLIKTLPLEHRDVLMVAYRSWLDAPPSTLPVPPASADAILLDVIVDVLLESLPPATHERLAVAWRAWLDAPR